MALAALISACRALDDALDAAGDGLRATLPLAGGTLVEHQARLAAAAGAGPIIILVERLPAALTAAVDRLRRDGLRVEIARGLADAVDRIHPDEALLLFADGCVAGVEVVTRIAASPVPAMLTVPDDADHGRFERIDAAARWGGLLLIDGARLRGTAARLGEWDLESTLLRRAVQESATRIGAYDEGDASLAIVETAAALGPLDRTLAAGSRRGAHDWPARFLFAPSTGPAMLPLLRRGIPPPWVALAAVAIAWLAVPFAVFGWCWTALALLLLSGPVAATGRRLAEICLAPLRRAAALEGARAVAATLVLLLLAADLATTLGWGCWLLAMLVPAGMAALSRERTILARLGDRTERLWLASLDGLVWVFLAAAIAGSWIGGIALLAAYALGSFAVVQHRAARWPAGGRV